MSAEEVTKLQAATPSGLFGIGEGGIDAPALLFWAFVGIPLAWGVRITLKSVVRIVYEPLVSFCERLYDGFGRLIIPLSNLRYFASAIGGVGPANWLCCPVTGQGRGI